MKKSNTCITRTIDDEADYVSIVMELMPLIEKQRANSPPHTASSNLRHNSCNHYFSYLPDSFISRLTSKVRHVLLKSPLILEVIQDVSYPRSCNATIAGVDGGPGGMYPDHVDR